MARFGRARLPTARAGDGVAVEFKRFATVATRISTSGRNSIWLMNSHATVSNAGSTPAHQPYDKRINLETQP